eukprot:9092854-Ditylum_brightwellii.AAC.1
MEQINEKLDVITKLIQAIPTTGNNKKGGSYKVNKNTAVLHALRKKMGIKTRPQGQTPWEVVRLENNIVETEEGQ